MATPRKTVSELKPQYLKTPKFQSVLDPDVASTTPSGKSNYTNLQIKTENLTASDVVKVYHSDAVKGTEAHNKFMNDVQDVVRLFSTEVFGISVVEGERYIHFKGRAFQFMLLGLTYRSNPNRLTEFITAFKDLKNLGLTHVNEDARLAIAKSLNATVAVLDAAKVDKRVSGESQYSNVLDFFVTLVHYGHPIVPVIYETCEELSRYALHCCVLAVAVTAMLGGSPDASYDASFLALVDELPTGSPSELAKKIKLWYDETYALFYNTTQGYTRAESYLGVKQSERSGSRRLFAFLAWIRLYGDKAYTDAFKDKAVLAAAINAEQEKDSACVFTPERRERNDTNDTQPNPNQQQPARKPPNAKNADQAALLASKTKLNEFYDKYQLDQGQRTKLFGVLSKAGATSRSGATDFDEEKALLACKILGIKTVEKKNEE